MGGDNRRSSRSYSRRWILTALGVVLGSGGIVSAQPGRDPEADRDELLVGITADESLTAVENDVQSAVEERFEVPHRNDVLAYFTVELPDDASDRAREAVKRAIERRPGVEYVEENVTYETQLAPNDPNFGSQYAPQLVNAPTAWETTTGSEDVTVAVVDTGSQYDHPDLQAQYGSDVGIDVADGDDDPYPETSWFSGTQSHGTHVSGCASASTNNETGVAGISDSRLLSVRALDESGGGSTSDIADGIQWAADQGADIVNLSLGGVSSSTLENAVYYADQQGTTVIAAAGNDGGSVAYPAAYDVCVAVSAIDPDENIAEFSNRGPNVDVAAPGVNVLSTVPTDSYSELSGTSMASPVAAGVAALGLAVDSSLSPAELRQRLRDTAADIGLSSDLQGAGRVDAANIVGAGDGGDDGGDDGDTGDSPPTVDSLSTSTGWWSDTVTADWAVSDADGDLAAVEGVLVDGSGNALDSASTSVSGSSASGSFSLDPGLGTASAVVLTVTDAAGNTAAAESSV